MSTNTVLLIIFLSGCISYLLRLTPFLLFGGRKEISPTLRYLGEKLPYAVMAMLVVYCLKGIGPADIIGSAVLIGSVIVTAIIHLWKRNLILSIAVGTVCYMLLVHII